MVQLRITKGVFAFIFLVVVQVFILRSMFAPTLLHSSDAPVDHDFVPEFLAYKSIEQEAFNADIEELQRRLESAHESLVAGTAANTNWQEEKEMKLAQEREQNEKERIEFHRLLEEATEKKNKKDRENKEKLLLLNRIVKNTFSAEEWEMRPVPDEWTTRHVMEWARRSLTVDSEDLLRLSELKLSGKGLLKLRKEDLLSSSFPLGTATLMADGIASLKEQKASIVEDDHEEKKASKRKRVVAVVGAGYGGMSTARELLENGCTPILIEESRKPGGIWIYDADPEVTSGYYSLHAQGSASDINFRNFIIPPTYTGRLTIHQMGTHMKNFWDKFTLEKYAVFNTMVTEIEVLGSPFLDPPKWLPVVTENKLFRIHWIKKEMKESGLVETTGYFDVDAVVEAIGRNHVPNLPTSNTSAYLRSNYIEGYDEFTGISIHSKSYRVPADFVGKTVIVAGGGKSGHDVAEDLRKANVTTFHASQNQGDHNRITKIVQERDGSFTVHFQGELSADSEKMLDLDDAKKPPAQAMSAIAERNKAKMRWMPISNVGAIIWAWGWKIAPVPVTTASNSVPLSKGFHNDVLSKDLPGYARVGTVSFLGTTRVQATYVGRVIGSRIPIDTTSSDYNATQRNWGHPGSDQYVWHDLVSY